MPAKAVNHTRPPGVLVSMTYAGLYIPRSTRSAWRYQGDSRKPALGEPNYTRTSYQACAALDPAAMRPRKNE